jgi:hypothetical protein
MTDRRSMTSARRCYPAANPPDSAVGRSVRFRPARIALGIVLSDGTHHARAFVCLDADPSIGRDPPRFGRALSH